MDVFPSFWRLADRRVIVVGGSDAAERKLRLLTRTEAALHVFAPGPVTKEIAKWADAGRLTLDSKAPRKEDIDPTVAFAVVATEDDALAHDAVALFKEARVPVNAVDRTALCDFLIPSIVDRNPVVIGIATGGAAPILARGVRETLEAILPQRLGNLARFAQRFRKAVSTTISDGTRRRAFWENFFAGPIAKQVLAGDEAAASDAMISAINHRDAQAAPTGAISLISLPSEEPDLLSLRGLRRLQRADCVFHHSGFGPAALELVRRDADRVSYANTAQALVDAVKALDAGKTVVVLGLPGTLPQTNFETLHHGDAGLEQMPLPALSA